jgi:hypothetical protein
MKAIRFLFAPGFCLLFFISITMARDPESRYSQTYMIFIKGEAAGTETVTEASNDSGDVISRSEHEISVTDNLETKRMTFSTKMILSKTSFIPASYEYRYTTGDSGDSYHVEIKNGRITRTLNKGGRTSEVTTSFTPNMVVLDHNVYHQYDYLIRKYDAKKGGRQMFADFIPIIGNDIKLAVTFLGDEKLEYGKSSLPIRKYRIEFVDIWSGTLSMDKNGRLVRLEIPAQDLEVLRKDLYSAEDH